MGARSEASRWRVPSMFSEPELAFHHTHASNDGFGTPTAPREVVRWTLPIFSKLCSRGLSRGSLLAYRMAMSRDLADRPLQSARGRLGWGIFALHAMAGVTCNAHTARLH